MKVTCNKCGKQFNKIPSMVKPTNYCNVECMKGGRGRIIVNCSTCGKEVERSPSQILKNVFCSIGCTKKFTSARMEFINADRERKENPDREHPLYKTWQGMKNRCLSKTNKAYPNYGGRGIKICDRWKNSFHAFVADMGLKPTPKHTIERVNNDGNYEKSNCVWATKAEQNRNKRTTKNNRNA